jgi:uncharacterized peroxidase-related enzyme
MMAHSLRPHSMEAHMAIYKYVLHHSGNTLPKWYLEAIGVYVSWLNQCHYCVEHHFEGLITELRGDRQKAESIRSAFESGNFEDVLDPEQAAGLAYAARLTTNAADLSITDIDTLRSSGYDDGEILEINQVTAYFNYANRTVLGLGVDTEGDVLGLAPRNNDPGDWSHG